MNPLLQKNLNNRYTIIKKLGESAMSTVFQADDAIDKSVVAIKVLKPQGISDRIESIIRFKNEAVAVSRLNHPNIVRVIEIFEVNGVMMIAMEYVDGESLHDRLEREGTLPLGDALEIMAQICRALEHVHAAGIVHRDLKPGNILLKGSTGPVEVKLIDFGLSTIKDFSYAGLGDIGQSGLAADTVAGTFGFIAPEQLQREAGGIDERADLYSLGAVFYRMVTGIMAFAGDSAISIFHQQLARMPQQPSIIRPELPPIIESIIMKLLCKDPSQRYQGARGLFNDLYRAASGESDFTPGLEDRVSRLAVKTALVGRDDELAALKERFIAALDGGGSVCLVSGDAGMGKTRLLDEMRRSVFKQGCTSISGSCFAGENKNPYGPLADALDLYLRRFARYPEFKKNEVRTRLKRAAGSLGEILLKINPMLEDLIGRSPALVPLEPDREKGRFLFVLCEFLYAVAAIEEGLVVILDDLQWADEGTLSVLAELMHDIDRHPLLVLGSFRPGETGYGHGLKKIMLHAREKKYAVHVFDLGPLVDRDMRMYLGRMLNRDERHPAIARLSALVTAKSGGNPFFAREIIKQLIDEQAVVFQGDGLRIDEARLEGGTIPARMVEILLKRISALTDEEKEVLSCAAVIGKKFDLPFLFDIYDDGQNRAAGKTAPIMKEEIVAIIDRAIALTLVEEDVSAQGTIAFTHDTIREAFYTALGPREREDIHRTIIHALERAAGPQPVGGPFLFALAYHSIMAHDADRILAYAVPAGIRARENHAYDDAVEYLSQALAVIAAGRTDNAQLRRDLQKTIGDITLIIGDHDKGIDIFIALLPEVHNPVERAYLYKQISQAYFRKGDARRCEEFGRTGLALLGERLPIKRPGVLFGIARDILVLQMIKIIPAPLLQFMHKKVPERERMIIWFSYALGWSYALNDSLKFVRTILRMRSIAERRIGPSRELAMALAGYGTLCAVTHRFGASLRFHARSRAMSEALHDEWGIAQSYQLTAFSQYFNGDLESALAHYDRSIELFSAIGDRKEVGNSLQGKIWNYLVLSDYGREKEAIDQYNEISRRIGDEVGICYSHYYLAGYYRDTGDLLHAMEEFMTAFAISGERGIGALHCMSLVGIAGIYLAGNDISAAIIHYERARELVAVHRVLKESIAFLYFEIADAYMADFRTKKDLSPRDKKRYLGTIRYACYTAIQKTRNSPLTHGGALRAMAMYHALAGKKRAAHYFARSLALLRKIGYRSDVGKTLYEYGVFLSEHGQSARAHELISESYAIFKEIGNRTFIKKPQQFLGIVDTPAAAPLAQMYASIKDDIKVSSVISLIRDISATSDRGAIIDRALAMLLQATGAGRGAIVLRNSDNSYHTVASIPVNPDERHAFSDTIIRRTMDLGEPVLSTNAEEERAYADIQSITYQELKSILSVPIKFQGRVLGVCCLDNPFSAGMFTRHDIDTVELIMSEIAITIGMANLSDDLNAQQAIGPSTEFCARFGITRREAEIIVLLIKGYTTKAIAEKLGIAYLTTNVHKRNIYAKTGVKSRAELLSLVRNDKTPTEL